MATVKAHDVTTYANFFLTRGKRRIAMASRQQCTGLALTLCLYFTFLLSLSAAAIVAIADDLPARDPSCPLLPCISFDCRLQHEKIVDPIHRFAIQYATTHLAVSFLIQLVAQKRGRPC